MAVMDKLGQVDLSLKLSSSQSEARVVALQRRLLHLRLLAGGLVGDGRLGAAHPASQCQQAHEESQITGWVE